MGDEVFLHQDQDIDVILRQGNSRFLLITFSNAGSFGGGGAFWAKPVAEKLDLNAIGIVSKRSNWFPKRVMDAVQPKLRDLTGTFDKVITYGTSMGAYGATKFGRSLGASATIAFAPQFSIDPSEIPPEAQVFSRHFGEENIDMRIKVEDLAPKIYLFYDPYQLCDRTHAELIASLSPNVKTLPAPYAGHELVHMFAGAEKIRILLSACLAGDIPGIRKSVHVARRQVWTRPLNLGCALASKRPRLAEQVFQRSASRATPLIWDQFRMALVQGYVKSGDLPSAIRHVDRIGKSFQHLPSLLRVVADASRAAGDFERTIAIMARLVDAAPSNPELRHKLAWDYVKSGDYLKAVGEIDKAIKIATDSSRLAASRSRMIALASERGLL